MGAWVRSFGLPQYFSAYNLPSIGSTDPHFLSYAGVMVSRLPAGTNLTGIPTYDQHDGKGLRVDTCCTPGLDCLQSDPTAGWYQSSAFPTFVSVSFGKSSQHVEHASNHCCCCAGAGAEVICQYAGIVGPTQHDMLTAVATAREPNLSAICGASVSAACRDRYNVLKSLYNAGNTQFTNAETDARDRTNSIIFNAFIFCQVRLIMLLAVILQFL